MNIFAEAVVLGAGGAKDAGTFLALRDRYCG